jgi:hypothetical protein
MGSRGRLVEEDERWAYCVQEESREMLPDTQMQAKIVLDDKVTLVRKDKGKEMLRNQ